MKKQPKLPTLTQETITVTRWRGLLPAARYLGISRSHLSYVLNGHRQPGRRLRQGLKQLGIVLPPAPLEGDAPSSPQP